MFVYIENCSKVKRMRISKIKYDAHPALGDLELDLINPNTNAAYDTILLVGENGTGKTTILSDLSSFMNGKSLGNIASIEYFVETDKYEATHHTNPHWPDYFYMVKDALGVQHAITNSGRENSDNEEMNRMNIRRYGCVFSKARADYKTDKIQHTTTKKLDQDKTDADDVDDFTSLKQLIIDIENQDNAEFAALHRNNGSSAESWGVFFKKSRVYRFKNAFDSFFQKIKYDRTEDVDNEKVIFFKKNNKDISIDHLSTGEKQIVFRGTQLLKNNKNLDGSLILIDEPELSMHPKWEKNILNYYLNLFKKDNTQVQMAQIFMATHSEYVLQEALRQRNNILTIVITEKNGIVKIKKLDMPLILPSLTSAEVNYLAFDIVSNDFHTQLYGHIQNKHSLTTVKDCDEYIRKSSGYKTNVHAKNSNHGKTTYQTLCTFIRNDIHHPSNGGNMFTEDELRRSIELLISLC